MRHASVEVLSSYLDDELAEGRRLRIESHLEACEECQRRLDGLHRVVQRLEGLERIPPVPGLEQKVLQGVGGREWQDRLLDRLERGARGLHVERWVWMPTLGMIMALASIIYLFSWGLQRQQQGLSVVPDAVLPPAETTGEIRVPTSEEDSALADALLDQSPRRVREEARSSDTAGLGLAARFSEVGGRQFDLQGGIWIERGVDSAQPSISLAPAEAAVPEWREQLPSLPELERLGGPVRLRVGDQLVQLEFDRLR